MLRLGIRIGAILLLAATALASAAQAQHRLNGGAGGSGSMRFAARPAPHFGGTATSRHFGASVRSVRGSGVKAHARAGASPHGRLDRSFTRRELRRNVAGRSLQRSAARRPAEQTLARRGGGYAGRGGYHGRGGYIGWAGRVFWPEASRDLFGYTFRPASADEALWAYAYDDVFAGIFWPPSQPSANGVDHPEERGDRPRKAEPGFAALSPFARICSDRAPGLTDWPFERIEQSVRPADAQRTAFDELKDASAAAVRTLRAACPTQTPASAVERLEAIEQRLAALVEAVGVVRPALENFYGALNDEQKAQVNAIGAQAGLRGPGEALAAGSKRNGRADQAPGCPGEPVAGYRERTFQHIERVVRPTEAQRASLDDLRSASARATDMLRIACAGARPATPTGRLDAIGKRLEAMLHAVKTMRPALANFYGLLSNEQKARFNAMSARNG